MTIDFFFASIYSMSDLSKILSEINLEYSNDVKFSIDIMSDKLLMIPAIKHKWVSKWINTKHQIKLLMEERDRVSSIERKDIVKSLKVDASEDEIRQIKSHNAKRVAEEIDPKIKDLQFLEVFYKALVDQLSYNFTGDIKNIIDMHKLETL